MICAYSCAIYSRVVCHFYSVLDASVQPHPIKYFRFRGCSTATITNDTSECSTKTQWTAQYITPPKTNILNPKIGGLEKVTPFKHGNFWYLCYISREYPCISPFPFGGIFGLFSRSFFGGSKSFGVWLAQVPARFNLFFHATGLAIFLQHHRRFFKCVILCKMIFNSSV